MANCCYCGKKVGFLGTRLKDGAGICTMCSFVCGKEFVKNGKISSSSELSKLNSQDILKFFNEDGVNHEDIKFFKNELPPFIQELKKTLNVKLNWQWNFIGENDFASIISSFNKTLHHRGDEVPVAFRDESLFGNNTSGILITTKRIYHVTSMNFHEFELCDTQSISSFRSTLGESEPHCRIKWCSSVNNIEISGENPYVSTNVLLFWGNLFNFILTKEKNELLNRTVEENDVQKFFVSRKTINAVIDDSPTTPLQSKMLAILLENSFSDYDKNQTAPINDWGDLSSNTPIIACEKHTLLTWKDYSFYTDSTMYYHCKKQNVHTLLNYKEINEYDVNTSVVDYGAEHKKINVSLWNPNVKNFIKQIAHIKKMEDEKDTSVLEYCFNYCSDFKSNLRFFKTNEIKNVFSKQCQTQNAPKLLQENFEHIEIRNMSQGNIELCYWEYFPKVRQIDVNENDSENDRQEKELEQERLYKEAEERIEEARRVSEQLPTIKADIVLLFKEAIYNLYGVLFEKDNICFLDEPDFTYEEGVLDKVQSKVAPIKYVLDSMMETTAKQMADVERKYKNDK